MNCDDSEPHPSCPKEDPEPDPSEGCTAHPCIASVGKWHRPPASDYAEVKRGTYTELSSNDFAKILAALPEDNFQALCDAQDVLIFEWDSPNIKGLDWDSLIDYMACGGDVIWEDTNNIDKLQPDVITADIRVHDKTPSPKTVMFDGGSLCVTDAFSLCAAVRGHTTFDVVNNHIDLTVGGLMMPFLIQTLPLEEADKVLGLYGVFGNGGCIVMTGPDNNYHGALGNTGPNGDAMANQYDLLFNELDWVLLSSQCTPPPP